MMSGCMATRWTRWVLLVGLLACEETGDTDGTDTGSDTGDAVTDDGSVDDNAGGDGSDDGSDDGSTAPASCGDSIVQAGEACDNGDANSDTTPDACRTNCLEAYCGDAVEDSDEGCDDGNAWGGDGCTPACANERGALESEPNDVPAQAQWVSGETTIHGSLRSSDDDDCFAVDVDDDGYLTAEILDDAGACPGDTILRMYHPDSDEPVASAFPLSEGEGCTLLDPVEHVGARHLEAGRYTVCVEGFAGVVIEAFKLSLDVGEDACTPDLFPVDPSEDLDGDGLANRCDPDADNDGVPDEGPATPGQPQLGPDNCPLVPNWNTTEYAVDGSGWFTTWIQNGPWTGQPTRADADGCNPSDNLLSPSDGAATPELGEVEGTGETALSWTAVVNDNTINHLDYYSSGTATPREVYNVVYVNNPDATARTAQLGIGSDDGVRAWVNGVEVASDETCRGIGFEQTVANVTLNPGRNRVMFKVRDQGGGWGLRARFRTTDTLQPMTDLTTSLSPNLSFVDNQNDSDADGAGDLCDADPGNPAVQ